MGKRFFIQTVILPVLGLLLLSSCSNAGKDRLYKKFVSRFNAKEYACAAAYINPIDKTKFAFFVNEVMSQSPHAFLDIVESTIDDDEMIVTCKWGNADKFIRSYFENIGKPLSENDEFTDTIRFIETPDGECMSFDLGYSDLADANLQVASVSGDVESMNIRSGASTGHKIIGSLDKSKDLVVEKSSKDWAPCFFLDDNAKLVKGYIYTKNMSISESGFFSVGWFDSFSLLVALLVFVVICVPLIFLSSLLGSVFESGVGGIVIGGALVVGLLYALYQVIEKILFELFIINLPY